MTDFTTRDGCRISYQVHGNGPKTLVIAPGWSQTAAQFDRMIPLLGPDYTVVAYDHRNHGESGRLDQGARIASLAMDLRELLDELSLAKAHLMGHSMGCSIIWSFIDQFGTDRISSVVWIDQPTVCALVPWLEPEDASQVGAIVDFPGAAAFVQGVNGPDQAQVRADFLTSMLTKDISSEDYEFLLAENMKLEMPFGARLLLDHVMQDWRDVLPRVDVPSLVTGGEVSHVMPSSQEFNAAQIPGAKLHVFTRAEGGAHFPFYEKPGPFAATIKEFIDGVDADSSDAETKAPAAVNAR
ncbi:alpha/beta hydrolase [Nocardioides islandensis]|uniref:Alpha/beta hydrolase n=1 Tax=Nocardioides islandensis TaxID=433663 RepID=A0A930VI67_9ACTN|nr:alpha/beta hydrolase [Nocardioides islandensis]MBF4764380.1 alpha/beta hydrolase [Nocardioides islandensis]